ncbi:hypothetical protein SAMN05518672_103535 [Chitinophaga sp. CF118]|nr:hypothetical protein SAMN05518672_103535 [Chitinophaga sp. CF118]
MGLNQRIHLFLNRNPKGTIIISIPLFITFSILFYRSINGYRHSLNLDIRVSAMKGGEYSNFLDVLLKTLNQDSSRCKLRLTKVDASYASPRTIEQLDSALADIGLIQSNAKRNSKNVSSIAYVYTEPYFLITNKANLRSIQDIFNSKETLRIARLKPSSQTSMDILSILDFYGFIHIYHFTMLIMIQHTIC